MKRSKSVLKEALVMVQPYVNDLLFEDLEKHPVGKLEEKRMQGYPLYRWSKDWPILMMRHPDVKQNQPILLLHGLLRSDAVDDRTMVNQYYLFLSRNNHGKAIWLSYCETWVLLKDRYNAWICAARAIAPVEEAEEQFSPNFEDKLWRQLSYLVGKCVKPTQDRLDRLRELGIEIQLKLPASAGGTRRS